MSKKSQYTVQKIVGKRFKNGKTEYHIKWLGYEDAKDYTWEPKINLARCDSIVQEYEKSLLNSNSSGRANTAIRTQPPRNIQIARRSRVAQQNPTSLMKGRKQTAKPQSEEEPEIDEEVDNDIQTAPKMPQRRQTAIRSSGRSENSLIANKTKKPENYAPMQIEQKVDDQDLNEETKENLNHLGTGDHGSCKVESVTRGKDKNLYYKVSSGNQKRTMTREELTLQDPFALLYFYEKNIEFVKK